MVLRLCKGTGGRGDHEVTLTETLTFPVCDSIIFSVSYPHAMIRCASILLLFCFTASLLWCGDAECISGSGTQDCNSLLCNLLQHPSVPMGNTSNGHSFRAVDRDGSCICHLPLLPVNPIIHTYEFLSTPAYSNTDLFSPSPELKHVFHPPVAV